MTAIGLSQPLPQHRDLAWWVVASVAAHGVVMQLLPGWRPAEESVPPPLHVELRQAPPQIIPPKPLPIEQPPAPRERPKPQPQKPQPLQAAPRAAQPVELPMLTAPPQAPVAAATPVVPSMPEQKSAPPPAPPETSRERAPAAPAPVTLPRSDAAYLNNPRPNYPLAARRRGDQGTVYVRVLVTAEGVAGNARIEKSSGFPSLDDAALNAVRSWRFVPARQAGQAIESPYVVPVLFRLDP